MTFRSLAWWARYSRWGPSRTTESTPGYSLLLPVPGDLPVFLELALAVCRGQESAHRVETLVLTDQPSPEIDRLVGQAAPTWPGPLRSVALPPFEQWVLPRLGNPGKNHGAQLIQGVKAARGTHVLLHDADLFLMDERLHEDEYRFCREHDLDVAGIAPSWDPWFAKHGRTLVATWELCGRIEWFRRFPPFRHIGHDAQVEGGESHTFDTTFWPQFHSPAHQLRVGPGFAARTVHFNYTISTFRHFQKTRCAYHDGSFRLLLIRIFTDLFGHTDRHPDLPSLEDLVQGLGRGDASQVWYARGDRDAYRDVMTGLSAVIDGPWSDPDRAARCRDALSSFDQFFDVRAPS